MKHEKIMNAKNEPREQALDREVVITRVFNAAPRIGVEDVDGTRAPDAMAWAERIRMPVAKMDFRPGGTFHYCLRSSDGKEMRASLSIARSLRRNESSSSIRSPMKTAS